MSEIDWNRMLRIEFIFYSLMATVMVLQSTVDCISEEGIPELITRRQTGDVYRYYTNSEVLFLCGEGTNLTYLVHERQCVDEEQLLNGTCIGFGLFKSCLV